MGDGDFKIVPSTLKLKPVSLFSIPGLIFCCLVFAGLTISGCYSGQNRQVSAGENDQEARNVQQRADVDYSCSYFYFLWGRSAELEENFEEAKEAYEKALICDPEREYINRNLVGVLIKMGEEEEALTRLKGMISRDGDREDIDNLFMLARLYAQMDKYQKAVETCRLILDIEPENQSALLFLGTLHARNDNFEEARKILEKLVDINSQSFMGYSYLARLYRELELFDQAATAYDKALEIHWSKTLAWEAVRFYEEQDMFEEAVNIYEQFLEEDGANLKLRGRLVKLYLRMNKIDEAVKALQKMKDYMVDTLQLDIAIGRFLLEQRKFEEAADYFREMLDQSGEEHAGIIRGFLALSYHEAGDEEKAKEVLKDIPQSSGAYEDAVLMLMSIYRDEENIEKAISLLENAISGEESRRPSFYMVLAELYREQGKSQAGIKIYEEGSKHFPDDAEFRYNFALFLDSIGRVAEALGKMEEVLGLDPDNPTALNYVGYTWADQGKNLDQALAYIKKAVSAKPESGFIRDSLGWVYYKRGEYEKAVTELEKAVELEPEDPTINEHLGDAYRKLNELEKAQASYRKAYRLYEEEEKLDVVKEKLEELDLD